MSVLTVGMCVVGLSVYVSGCMCMSLVAYVCNWLCVCHWLHVYISGSSVCVSGLSVYICGLSVVVYCKPC